MEENKIMGYLFLLTWGISGGIISLVTWVIMWHREGFKFRRIYWWDVVDFLEMFFSIALLSYAWIVLNIYWHYDYKRILKKIKEGKTSAKDLF